MARAYNQAQKFGAEMAIPDEVSGLDVPNDKPAVPSCCNCTTASGSARGPS